MNQYYTTYKDVRIAYYTFGNPKGKAVVWLHGFLEDSRMWTYLLDQLPQSFRHIFIDLPGFGRSQCIAYVHTMDEMADVVMAVLRELKIRKAAFIGHSMGGYVSLAFGEKYPESVRALCLFHSTAAADSPEKIENRNRGIELAKNNPQLFSRTTFLGLFADWAHDLCKNEIEEQTQIAVSTSSQGIVAALEGMKIRPDRTVLLHFAPYQIFHIVGSEDPVFKGHSLDDQLTAPKVKAFVLKAGHMSHIENRKDLLPVFREYFKSL
ncbi:MAG: alpha/beta fold hydrolase [Thermaurantimonas sp.]|uniref:alpha/beta fold hydrolase n=1 Tax=Thermaurantimonas sp. TaxID=2681568 RepID=UPI003919CBE1